MKKNQFLHSRNLSLKIIAAFVFIFNSLAFTSSLESSETTQTPEERELYNTLPGENQKGGILDATNPMELMNRLRRATAMDDATPPADAIDAALQSFEQKTIKLDSKK